MKLYIVNRINVKVFSRALPQGLILLYVNSLNAAPTRFDAVVVSFFFAIHRHVRYFAVFFRFHLESNSPRLSANSILV